MLTTMDYWLGAPDDFDACLAATTVFLSEFLHRCEFKVGITGSLLGRWQLYQKKKEGWQKMHLLYVADRSKKHFPDSTGSMEKALGQVFHKELPGGCVNRKGHGGEMASKTWDELRKVNVPHYCYVVFRR